MREITHEEWLKEGKALFGTANRPTNYRAWKFVCPVCENVASVGDYEQYKDKGATPSSASQECIGRYAGGRSAMSIGLSQPCDYAAFGLIGLCETVVVMPDGTKIPVFEFARPEDVGSGAREPAHRDCQEARSPAERLQGRAMVLEPGDES